MRVGRRLKERLVFALLYIAFTAVFAAPMGVALKREVDEKQVLRKEIVSA